MKKIIWPLLCAVALLYSHTVCAFDNRSFLSAGAEGQVAIERHDRDIESNQLLGELRILRFGIKAYESPYSWVQGGFHFGYMKASHDNALLTSNLTPTGEFFGITLRSPRDHSSHFAPHWSLSYTYNKVDKSEDTLSANIDWHDYQAELGMRFRLGDLFLSAGGYYAGLEGEEDRREVISNVTHHSSQQFKGSDKSGAFASVGYLVNRNGRIELAARAGALQGGSIIFSVQY